MRKPTQAEILDAFAERVQRRLAAFEQEMAESDARINASVDRVGASLAGVREALDDLTS